MIGYEKYHQLMVLLVTIMVVDVFLIFSIYSDLLYAIANPLMSGVLGLFLGVFLSGTLCSTANQNNESNGLLPLRVFLLGIVAGFLLAWDDFLLLSDDIRQPWFWSAVICSYVGWLMGAASIRYIIIDREKILDINHQELDAIDSSGIASDDIN